MGDGQKEVKIRRAKLSVVLVHLAEQKWIRLMRNKRT